MSAKERSPGTVAAIVLAAGRGTRFGESPKLLAELAGKPLVRHAVDAALGGGLAPVLVIVGHREAEIRTALAGSEVIFVLNAAYADGLSTSLKAGFAALPPSADAAIVLLGDMPRVPPELVRNLAQAWQDAGRPDAVVPTWEGRRGNPVLLSRSLAPELERLSGDVGAGPLLRGRADVFEVPVTDEAVTLDVDTPATLDRLSGQASTRTTPSRIAE